MMYWGVVGIILQQSVELCQILGARTLSSIQPSKVKAICRLQQTFTNRYVEGGKMPNKCDHTQYFVS